MRLHLAQPPVKIEQAVLMRANLLAFISVIIAVTLSYNVFKTLGLSEYGGLYSVNISCDLAKGIVIFSVPIGILVIMKAIYIPVRWFVRTWKSGGQAK